MDGQASHRTPMMRQFQEVKARYPDCIVFFRLGDFYEMFGDDAHTAARILDITLTSRETTKGERVPMCGVPYHAADQYLAKLVEAGYRVAICEQVEDPRAAKGLVRREVVRVVTPGTLWTTDDQTRYVAAVALGTSPGSQGPGPPSPAAPAEGAVLGLAYADVSTGEFVVTQLEGQAAVEGLLDELARLQVAECLLGPSPDAALREVLERQLRQRGCALTRTPPSQWRFGPASALLAEQFGAAALDQARAAAGPLALAAGGALLAYLRDTQKVDLRHLQRLRTELRGQWLAIDAHSRRNLELVRSLRDGSRQNSLLDVLDVTVTAMGRRLLRRWVERPLVDRKAIERRLDAVETLVRDPFLRDQLRRLLAGMQDLPRLIGRVGYQQANARDLLGLARALERLPSLAEQLRAAEDRQEDVSHSPAHPASSSADGREEPADPGGADGGAPCAGGGWQGKRKAGGQNPGDDAQPSGHGRPPAGSRWAQLQEALHPELASLGQRLREALVDDPPTSITEGGLIRDGFDPEVDELRQAMREGRAWIAALEAKERERTGIKSLKVGFNKVFGYYIEVTRPNRHLVPSHYERRQTLANAERFVTPDLKEVEARVLGAEERLAAREHQLFCQLRDQVAAHIPTLQEAAEALAEVDVLACLAEVAVRYDYVRPRLTEDRRLRIRAGRHPVLDRALQGRFVPNDVDLDGEDHRIMLITGPNMAGKSTFMRQVALMVIMAQMGSFVPAAAAEIGWVDRIFCRVGASDDLASGQSTFMVEVAETALAVHHATPRSLIILDEIGRGTSTFDGIAIARAVIEFIHDRIGARTLVSTHYHELTALADHRPGIRNYHAQVAEDGDEIRFLWRIAPGGADRSYGINVARLAGLPPEIIERAKEVLAELTRAAGPRQLSLADLASLDPAAALAAGRDLGGAPPAGEGRSGQVPTPPTGGSWPGPELPPLAAGAGAGGQALTPEALGWRRWLEELERLDLARMTPLDAMNWLYAWQRRLKRWRREERERGQDPAVGPAGH